MELSWMLLDMSYDVKGQLSYHAIGVAYNDIS